MPVVEYPEGGTFPGVIGRTAEESSPAWPAPVRARADAPNVVMIVLDDTGFGNLGCYGSPIATPNFDAIAANGLRYNNMHTTALCSPSRSCIVTGRNHHSNAMACITELATGYPGLQRRDAVRERNALGDVGGERLQHLHGRQVALDAQQPGDRGRPVRPVAAGSWLRALLRLPRWRHQSVVSRSGLRQPPGRAAEDAGAGLSPHRGPGRQGSGVHLRCQADRPEQAVLPTPVLRCDARSPPRRQGMGRPLQGRVRRRLGCLSRTHPRQADRTGGGARRHRTVAQGPRCPRLGEPVARRPSGSMPGSWRSTPDS